MRKEHSLNRSDHRAVILHLDVESFSGMGPPRTHHDNVKLRIRSVTSTRIKGNLSNTAEAYTKELGAMLGKNPGAVASRKDNTAAKRVKDATAAYKEASKSGVDLKAVTNTLSNAMDTLLIEAADRAAWNLRQSANRKARWSPTMAKHTAALKFLF